VDCDCDCDCECECECALPVPNMAAPAAAEEDCGRETFEFEFEAFGTSGRENAVGFEFAYILEVVAVLALAFVLVFVLLVGKDAGFCDIMVGLSALSLLKLLVGAVAAVLFLLSDSDGGLCKGAGEEEEEFLRCADDGCC
jgi:hypothetical protein